MLAEGLVYGMYEGLVKPLVRSRCFLTSMICTPVSVKAVQRPSVLVTVAIAAGGSLVDLGSEHMRFDWSRDEERDRRGGNTPASFLLSTTPSQYFTYGFKLKRR